MEAYQKQYIDVQTLYYHLNELRSLFEAFGNQTAIDTLNVVVGKIDDMTKVRGVRLKCKHATTNQELEIFAQKKEELERYFDYIKESQAKEFGIFCYKNGMVKTSVEQDAGPFHGEVVQSEIEILTTNASELIIDSSVNESKSNVESL